MARRHPIGIGLITIAIFLIPSGAASAGSGSLDALGDAASPTIVDTDVVTETVSETTGTVSETTGEVTETVSETTGEVTGTVSETTGNVTDTVSESTAEVAGTASDSADQVSGAGRTGGEATNTPSDDHGGSGSSSGSAASADTTRAASNVRPVRLGSAPTRVVSVLPADRPFYVATSLAAAVSTGGQSFSLNVGGCNLHRTGDAVQCGDTSPEEGVLGLFLGVTGVALLFLFALGVAFASSGAASLVIARRLSGASRAA